MRWRRQLGDVTVETLVRAKEASAAAVLARRFRPTR